MASYQVPKAARPMHNYWSDTVFVLDTTNKVPTYTVLKQVGSGEKDVSKTNLTVASDGKLFMTISNTKYDVFPNSSTVHSITVAQLDTNSQSSSFTELATLNGYQEGRIIQGSDGKLYLATQEAMFEINSSVSPAKTTLIFNASKDSEHVDLTKITQGLDGMFYGTGTSKDKNALVQVEVSGTEPVYSVLHYFNSATEGTYPQKLFQTDTQKFVGKTIIGGKNGMGVLFQLDISKTPTVSDLLSFSDRFPINPILIQDSDRKIYGIDYYSNIIFRLDTTSSTSHFIILYHFPEYGYVNSFLPGKDGNLYGAIERRSVDQSETSADIFRLDTKANPPLFTLLRSFDHLDGSLQNKIGLGIDGNLYDLNGSYKIDLSVNPPIYREITEPYLAVNLTKGSDGKFYGISQTDGSNNSGTIFQVDASSGKPVFTVLHNFAAINNRIPNTELVEGRPGKFYGTVKSNMGYPSTDFGNIFELDLSSGAPVYKVIYQFKHYDGATPELLMKASDGNLYGVTNDGGSDGGKGTIFRVRLSTPPPINSAPNAKNDSFVLTIPKHKRAVMVAAPGVLKNDSDANGDKITVAGVKANKPKIIRLEKKGGFVALYADGHFVYLAPNNCFFKGSRTFKYQATDGIALNNTATVTLTFHSTN